MSNDEYEALRRAMWFQQNFYITAFGDSLDKEFSAKVLADKKAYIKYSKSIVDYKPSHTTIAYFDLELNQIVIHKELNDFVTTFRHEISHGISNMYCAEMHLWLDEGLAELFEDIHFSSTEGYAFTTKAYSKKHYGVVQLLSEGGSWEELFYEEMDKVELAYLKSWGVVNYLYMTNKELLYEIIRDSCRSLALTMERNYPGGVKMLEADMRVFYLNGN